jgi:hypothetical protein
MERKYAVVMYGAFDDLTYDSPTTIIASVLVALCMVRGPLFQRASLVVTRRDQDSGSAELPINQFLSWQTPADRQRIVRQMIQFPDTGPPIPANISGCRGECESTIRVSLELFLTTPPLSNNFFTIVSASGSEANSLPHFVER